MSLSYPESIQFLYALQKQGIKLGLDTIEALLQRLGRPHERYATLHIGGTNGKGSTAAMAAAVLQSAGYRVGLYTSPHLVDFRERIRVNGCAISEATVTDLTAHLRETVEHGLHPTFFEFTTALAFQHFADSDVEVAVVEVGLGGRFDATNVVTPIAAAITNIALDHQNYLGDTIEAIAFEKAGIIKPRVPVVVGRLSSEAAEVIRRVASKQAAPLWTLKRDFRVDGESLAGFHYSGPQLTCPDLFCPLAGTHQLDNVACALALLEVATRWGFRLSDEAIQAGLRELIWEGRLETVEFGPRVVLDGAHNPAAAQAVAAYLATQRIEHPDARIIVVVGMMRDKDREGFLRTVLPHADDMIVTQAQIPRAATVEELLASLGERAHGARTASHPADALQLARSLADPEDLILVTGSLILVGELKALLRGCELSPLRD
ncbi:MAG: folylpolyglutamate synthase/dihydrofolate synthase family protein [Nitrospirales bacterium]